MALFTTNTATHRPALSQFLVRAATFFTATPPRDTVREAQEIMDARRRRAQARQAADRLLR